MKAIVSIATAVMAGGLLAVSGAAFAQDAAKLAQEKACLACHSVDKRVVGPSFKEIAAKYRTDKTAEAKLVQKVLKGGSGVWGQVPMPPNTTVAEKDALILVKWIMSQK
jgi:cytochrome c